MSDKIEDSKPNEVQIWLAGKSHNPRYEVSVWKDNERSVLVITETRQGARDYCQRKGYKVTLEC